MSRAVRLLLVSAGLVVSGCAAKVEPHTVPEFEQRAESPEIVGDGMELRSYRLRAGRQEIRRALIGLDARLLSSNAQILRGLEYYELDRARLADLIDVTCQAIPWNVRWIGQSFSWQNMMPDRVQVESEPAWLALPGRTWSMMMEDGPVVYVEAMPMIGSERLTERGGRFEISREEDLRLESVLTPGRCIVLLGGVGIPLVEEEVLPDAVEPSSETLGSVLMRSVDESDELGSDLMVFIPHFTRDRLRPLRPQQQSAPDS